MSNQFEWDVVTNTATFSQALLPVPTILDPKLVAPPVSSSTLTYYVRFTTTSGTTAPFDGTTLYQLNGFSFADAQALSIGSTGAGAGKIVFNPLSLSFTQANLTPQLLQFLARGTAFKEVDVLAYDASGHLVQGYSFGLVGGTSLAIGSASTTTATLEYGSESIQTYATSPAGVTTLVGSSAWNRVTNTAGFSTTGTGTTAPAAESVTLDPKLVAPPVAATLTYYVRFTSNSGTTAPFDGKTLYQLNGFSFDDQQALNIGSQSTGLGAGKVVFDPLSLSFTQANLTPQLLQYLASGTAFKEVDVFAYDAGGHLAQGYSFGFAAGTSLAIDSAAATTATLEYGSESIQTYATSPAGVTTLVGSSAWNRVTSTSGFSTTGTGNTAPAAESVTLDTKLVAPPVSSSTLSYYVCFTTYNGTTAPFDGKTLYQLNGFSFDDQQTVNIGSQSGGAGAGKVTFDPLNLSFTQADLTPQLLQYLARGTAFKEVDVLAYDAGGHLAQGYSFGLVGGTSLAIGSAAATTATLEYGSESIQTYATSLAGVTTLVGSAAWNRVANTTGFSTNGTVTSSPTAESVTLDPKLVAPPVANTLTYYVRFASNSGTTAPFDGKTLYQLNGFSFDDQQTVNIGSQSSGAGAGKVTFDPLNLSFTQANLTPQLLQYLASGTAFKEVDVLAYDAGGHLAQGYSFGLVGGTSLAIDSASTTTATLAYGSESIQTYATSPAGVTTLVGSSAWNRVTNTAGFSTTGTGTTAPAAESVTLDPKLVAPPVAATLTYYVRFTGNSGTTAPFDGKTLYQLNGFSFDDQQALNIGSQSTGLGAGKVVFDPLSLSFTQANLTPQLLQYLARGTAFKEVDVLAYDAGGHLAQGYSFGLVAGTSVAIDSASPTTATLEYGSESIQTYATSPAGATTLTASSAWNRVANTSGFSTTGTGTTAPATESVTLDTKLVAPPVSSTLSYYVRFTSNSGTTAPFDGKTLYQLNGFSFEDQQTVNIGSQSSGAGAGKVTFDPLNLSFTQANLTPQLLQYLAKGTFFKQVDVLGYDGTALSVSYSFGQVAGSNLAIASGSDKTVALGYGSEAVTTYSAPCFCSGVLILTESGKVAVEDLAVGDLVVTTDGDVRPIIWIGRRKVATRFADPLRCWPIRVKTGALDVNVPDRDLLVSPDHALLIDNVLINAGALVNGISIIRETDVPALFTYYHIELDNHALILADNVAAETFVDNVDRMGFDNWAEHEALYPDGRAIDELRHPRAKAWRQVPINIRAMLADRAEQIGAIIAAAAA